VEVQRHLGRLMAWQNWPNRAMTRVASQDSPPADKGDLARAMQSVSAFVLQLSAGGDHEAPAARGANSCRIPMQSPGAGEEGRQGGGQQSRQAGRLEAQRPHGCPDYVNPAAKIKSLSQLGARIWRQGDPTGPLSKGLWALRADDALMLVLAGVPLQLPQHAPPVVSAATQLK
jgi:hypothetical protein